MDEEIQRLVADPSHNATLAPDEAEAARWAVRWIRSELTPNAVWLQDRVAVMSEYRGDELTFGTADITGLDTVGELVVADVKTGRMRDVREQLNLYALGIMQREQGQSCRCCVLWVDLREVEEWSLLRTDAMIRAEELAERVREHPDPPVESEYCAWCANHSTCPLWEARRNLALTQPDVDDALAPILPDRVNVCERLDAIARDPQLAGQFWLAWRALEKAVDDAGIKTALLDAVASGERVDGWRTRRQAGRVTIDVDALRSWALSQGIRLPDDIFRRGEDSVALVREGRR